MRLYTVNLQAIAQAEAQKASLELRAAEMHQDHEGLQRELESLQQTVATAQADVDRAQQQLQGLKEKVSMAAWYAHPPVQRSCKNLFKSCCTCSAS